MLRQICNLIPNHLVPKLARETGAQKQARTFTPWGLHSGALSAIRGAKAPCRNTFSHANKTRDPALAERLFWAVLEHLRTLSPRFAGGQRVRLAHRFRRTISVVDSTVLQLVANCLDWAKHRRRKAAAKCHLRLDLQSFLPVCAIVDVAREHDNVRAHQLCARLQAGEIVLFDKAYVDFEHLYALQERGVFWVTRAKDDLACRVVEKLPKSKDPRVRREDLIVLTVFYSRKAYPLRLRRVSARVEVDGREVERVFLTNHFGWSAGTVAELYRCRWQIEVFFKQIKQTLQLSDFLGNSANAVRWQVWTALLCYVLLRFLACVHGWHHSFTRLFTVLRSTLWERWELGSLLGFYGTAGGSFRCLGQPQQAWLLHES